MTSRSFILQPFPGERPPFPLKITGVNAPQRKHAKAVGRVSVRGFFPPFQKGARGYLPEPLTNCLNPPLTKV